MPDAKRFALALLQTLSRPGDQRPVRLEGGVVFRGAEAVSSGGALTRQGLDEKLLYLSRRLGLEGGHPERMGEIWSAALADGHPRSPRELLDLVRRSGGPDRTEDLQKRWRAAVEPLLRGVPVAAGAIERFGPSAPPEERALRLELRPVLEEWPRRLLLDPWWATAEAPLPSMDPLPLDDVWVDLQMLDAEEGPALAGLETLRALLDQRYEERRWRAEPLALALERLTGVSAFIGPPGSGKTTLLKWIARQLVLRPDDSRFLLPLFVRLRTYVAWKREGQESGLLQFALRECGVRDPEQRSLWIHVLNEISGLWRERVLVLLDGWDEVPVEDRGPLLEEVRDLSCGFSLLITSRPAAFPARLAASRIYEIADLAPEASDTLIRRWFRGAGVPGQADALIRHLDHQPDLRRLVRNPFLLTLLCGISHLSHRREGLDLPTSRADLYRETLRLIFSHFNERYPETPLGADRERQMEKLALWLLDEAPDAPRFVFGPSDVVASGGDPDLLPRYLQPSRLLGRLAPEEDSHHFLHATFQEYLAAQALAREPGGKAVHRLRLHVHDTVWQEVFHFLSARPGPLRDTFWREMARLSSRPDRFGIVFVRLARWVAATGSRDGGQTLLGRDLRDLLWPFIERIASSRLWVDAYVELDAAGFVAHARDALQGAEPRLKARLQRAIGRVRNPVASRTLIDQILGDDPRQAAIAATQLHQRIDPEGLRRLREAAVDHGLRIVLRKQALQALGYARDGAALPLLLEILVKESDLAEEAVRALGRIGGEEATLALASLLEEGREALAPFAVRALGEMRQAFARDVLLDELARCGPDDPLVLPILSALVEVPVHRGSGLIVDLLRSGASEVRRAAAWALTEASGADVYQGLTEAARDDPEEEIRVAALEALEQMANPSEASWLLQRIEDHDRSLEERGYALRALLTSSGRWAGVFPEAEPLLARAVELALREPEGDLALEAVAHAHHAGPSVAARLIEICLDAEASPSVRELACAALGKMRAPSAVEPLLRLVRTAPETEDDEDQPLETGSQRVARAAAEALTRIGVATLLCEPGSTAFHALARYAAETGALIYEDHILGPDGREWARVEIPEPADEAPLERDTEGFEVPPPDLEIHVTVKKSKLTYQLHSASGKAGFTFQTVPGPELSMPLKVFARELFDQIEKLHEGYDVDQELLLLNAAASELVNLGQWLYRVLFPEPMKSLYRRFRKSVHTLQIVSDEAAIPWELIKPYDDSDPADIVDDDFLCMQFQLTRWLSGGTSPRPGFAVRRLACLSGSDDLPQGESEQEMLTDLMGRREGMEDASPGVATFREMERLLLQGGVDLYHFVGHGDFSPKRPAEASIALADRPFRARNLTGPIQTRMRQDRPLVFFNACRVGRQGWALAGLEGWASSWVSVCGCGAFLGPLWLVKDSAAALFARTFYALLEKGATLGQAALAARQAVWKKDPGRPNWLAYAVYGHPNAKVAFGTAGSSERRADCLPEDGIQA